MANFCDLHTHSLYSDGSLSPAALIREAQLAGLSAIALTDHNTLAGLPEFLAAANGTSVWAIPGVEISTGYQGKELHIVGLFLPEESQSALTAFLDIIHARKEQSNRDLVHRLCNASYFLDYDAILAAHPEGSINRAVIASALVNAGFVPTIQTAFRELLKPEKGFFQPPERIHAFEAISLLRDLKAVPVLAHPFLNLKEDALRQFLPEAKAQGLAAMETRYSTYTPETSALARSMAAEFGLMESGGSDYHGTVKPDIRLGIGRGDLKVPAAFARILQPKEA